MSKVTKSENQPARCGYVAIAGRPNVGKSTLFNALLKFRLSAITHKPQTTRHNIRGILTEANSQLIFVDTPGIHRDQKRLLNRALNRNVQAALEEVDIIVLLVDKRGIEQDEKAILKLCRDTGRPVLLCVNKVDRVHDKQSLLPVLAGLQTHYPFDEIIPISALREDNLGALLTAIKSRLPVAEFEFPEDQITDRSERFVVAELIREKILLNLMQEVPYAVFVEIETYEDKGELISIAALIWVERSTQKGIIVGKQGAMLKRIGTQARHSIEAFVQKKVMLKLWVKVKPDWQDEPAMIADFEK